MKRRFAKGSRMLLLTRRIGIQSIKRSFGVSNLAKLMYQKTFGSSTITLEFDEKKNVI